MVAESPIEVNQGIPPAAVPLESGGHGPRFLLNYLKTNKSGVLLVISCGLLSSISSFLLTLIIGDFFILQFQTGSSKGKLLAWLGIHLSTLPAFFRLFAVLLLLKFISSYLERYLASRQGERFVRQIRQTLFSTQMMTPAEQFRSTAFGNYLLRYSNDLKSVQLYLVKGVLGGVKQVLFTSMGLLLLFQINQLIGIISAGFFLLIIALMFLMSATQKKYIQENRRRRSNLLAFVTRSFSRFDKLKSAKREAEFSDKFQLRSDQLYQASLQNNRVESLLQSSAYSLQFGMIGCILWLMSSTAMHFTPGDGLLVVLLLLLMQGTVRGLLKVPAYFNKGSISLKKIGEIIKNGS